jgi:hypothetical protein
MLWGSTYVKAEVRAHHRPFASNIGSPSLASAPKQFVRVCASLRGSGFTSPFGLLMALLTLPRFINSFCEDTRTDRRSGRQNGERGIRDGMLRTMQHRQECGTRVRRWRKLEPVCRALGVPALQAEELASSAKRLFERCHICAAQHPPCMRAVRRCCFPPRLLASQRAPCCPPNRGASLDLHTSVDAIPCFQARGVRDMEDTPMTGQHDANARKNMAGEVRANVSWPCGCPC